MSNIVVGDAFDKIIAEVVQASQTDFEENGVSQQTLLELKQTWQQKLSARNIATMPWDPKPVAPPPSNGSMAAASNGHKYSAPPSQVSQPSVQRVKPEPATDATYDNSNFLPPTMNPELAHQRAQNLIAQQYGNQASASLNAMQQQQRGIALPGQAPKPMGLQLPGQTPQVLQQQYAQQLKQQQAAQEPRIKAETDGAAEYASDAEASHAWQALMAERRQITADDITRNESMMRDHIAQMTADFESGLMQPLNSKSLQNKSRRQKQIRKGMSSVPQLDGEFSDDEKPIKEDEDENAINSDLDDSGDEQANADDDDDEMDSMLCTYDKVQRVKNKWKCTLKDGVLAANGKEYLFHKATGEFEW